MVRIFTPKHRTDNQYQWKFEQKIIPQNLFTIYPTNETIECTNKQLLNPYLQEFTSLKEVSIIFEHNRRGQTSHELHVILPIHLETFEPNSSSVVVDNIGSIVIDKYYVDGGLQKNRNFISVLFVFLENTLALLVIIVYNKFTR